MNLATLKRTQLIARSIHDFIIRNDIPNISDHNIVNNDTDIWLRFASLNTNKMRNIIHFAILLIIVQNKSILISGEKVNALTNLFGINNYNLAKSQTFLCQVLDTELPLLQISDFTKISCNIILTRIYTKYLPHVKTQLHLYTHIDITKNHLDTIIQYWELYSNSSIETALIRAFKLKCSHSFALPLF